MITIAADAASDRCTIAATDGTRVVHRDLDGARGHAGRILALLDETLRDLDAVPRDIGQLLTGDGPGSFTGLRVVAALAKALAWRRQLPWSTAPSLRIRAAAHRPAAGGRVLALSDALRGELYAGCWEFADDAVSQVGPSPRAVDPAGLVSVFGAVDVVVGSIPATALDVVSQVTGRVPVTGSAALPDARRLFELHAMRGGTVPVIDAAQWEPEYGRPAEAQAVWERKHGRPLPPASGVAS
ncbi:MAG TPA: tRNA (adenosine(37)-N6)-threonylcarbamoyltransferase complex dimerization subunit type 1 TsaB [Gemmatimonadales bacterium]|nr:tRNA (adenosine(37)-N6)-threonylcarbamoyltransferase complex dimerization subunit type 1 TsaB [Gemmatimonadales bacterium]